MASVTRKRHSADFKSKVAVEAIRQQKTTNELTTKYGVHATRINSWKKQALTAIPAAVKGKHEREQQDRQAEIRTWMFRVSVFNQTAFKCLVYDLRSLSCIF